MLSKKSVPERCIGCTWPNEGPEGQCPGNMGIGYLSTTNAV